MGIRRRRWVARGLLLAAVIVMAIVARPLLHLGRTAVRDRTAVTDVPAGFADDASRMNRTAVASIVDVPTSPEEAERLLVELLERAARDGLPVSIAGARHTMGGHTIAPDGVVVNMLPLAGMRLDDERGLLHVGAGAMWSDVLSYLDERGWSVEIMQSNDSFSVGGSVSANCHGWQIRRPPIASSVRSFRLLGPDGAIRVCSRDENAELFGLALGGYGLFGIILDVELRVVRNEQLRGERHVVDAARLAEAFRSMAIERDDAVMAFARLCIVPDRMLEEAILTVFLRDEAATGPPPPMTEPELTSLKRTVFRGSVDSDYGKALRWSAEKALGQHLTGARFTRNQLLNEGVEIYGERSEQRTDILHEYFVPPERFNAFLGQLRASVTRHEADLLNATVRHLLPDDDTMLRYADREMLAIVLLFSQERTVEADGRMETMTRELIESALQLGGRYYLPYRLHATLDQLDRAYPQASRFFELKRHHDPKEVFQNRFYLEYARD